MKFWKLSGYAIGLIAGEILSGDELDIISKDRRV